MFILVSAYWKVYAYIKTPSQKLFHIRTQYFQQIQGKSDPVSVLTVALFWPRFYIFLVNKLFKHKQEKTAVFEIFVCSFCCFSSFDAPLSEVL